MVPWTSAFLITIQNVLKCYAYLILRLPVRPFSELVGEAYSSPICLDSPYVAVGILPLGLLCFTRCILTPWIFSCDVFSAVYDLDSLLRALLRSWGSFDCSMSPTFWRGFRSCQNLLLFFLRNMAVWYCAIYSEGLWYCLLVVNCTTNFM